MNVVVRSPTIKENSPLPGSRNSSAMCPSTGNAATGAAGVVARGRIGTVGHHASSPLPGNTVQHSTVLRMFVAAVDE